MNKGLLLFFLWIVVSALHAEPLDTGPKILKFQESGEFVWCGTKHLAISRHSKGPDAGIRLLTIDSGDIRQLTTTKTHRVVACTPDGKHIFYVENGVNGLMNELDIDNGKHQIIYINNPFQHETIEEAPINISGDLLIGPATTKGQIQLSDRAINVVRIPDAFSRRFVRGITWAEDGTLFLSIGSDIGAKQNKPQSLLIKKRSEASFREIALPSIKNTEFKQMGWSGASKRLYMLAWGDGAKLYEFDPDEPKHSLRLVAKDATELMAMPNGSLLYIQGISVDYSAPDSVAINKASHRLLLMRTPQGKLIELLNVPYKSIGISSIQTSPTGNDIAVRLTKIDGRNNQMEIQVFQHIGK